MERELLFDEPRGETIVLEGSELGPASIFLGLGTTPNKARSRSETEDIPQDTRDDRLSDAPEVVILPSTPNIDIVDGIQPEDPVVSTLRRASASLAKTTRKRSVSEQATPSSDYPVNIPMAYNEYGELVECGKELSISSKDLTTTQILRLINKAYHHIYRSRMREILIHHFSGSPSGMPDASHESIKDTAWEFVPSEPGSSVTIMLNEVDRNELKYQGPPRILDVGCGDGDWCFWIKQQHPDWCVEGVDDSARWTRGRKAKKFRDFMVPDEHTDMTGCFDRVPQPANDNQPGFTIRNVNFLLTHSNPLQHNRYSLVRGRDVFNKVENYWSFLEDVRLILQPDGVCEFQEIDPRTRRYITDHGLAGQNDHISRPQSDWTDNIPDRFREAPDPELEIRFPAWSQRIEEHLKAQLRPKDGIAAVNLKSWLQSIGFWDVKEVIFRLPIGGSSIEGQVLLNIIRDQLEMENTIPLLARALPKVCIDDLSSGEFFVNVHNLTARKPKQPRAGDRMADGSRKEMVATKYDARARSIDARSNQWRRFELDSRARAALEDSEWSTNYRSDK